MHLLNMGNAGVGQVEGNCAFGIVGGGEQATYFRDVAGFKPDHRRGGRRCRECTRPAQRGGRVADQQCRPGLHGMVERAGESPQRFFKLAPFVAGLRKRRLVPLRRSDQHAPGEAFVGAAAVAT